MHKIPLHMPFSFGKMAVAEQTYDGEQSLIILAQEKGHSRHALVVNLPKQVHPWPVRWQALQVFWLLIDRQSSQSWCLEASFLSCISLALLPICIMICSRQTSRLPPEQDLLLWHRQEAHGQRQFVNIEMRLPWQTDSWTACVSIRKLKGLHWKKPCTKT